VTQALTLERDPEEVPLQAAMGEILVKAESEF